MSSPTEDELIARVARGDAGAMEGLVTAYGPAVARIVRAYVARPSEVDDAIQETFLAVLRGASTYNPGVASVRAWLFAIARNTARRGYRREREEPTALDASSLWSLGVAAGLGSDAPDDALRQDESSERLARAIASLEPPDRELLVLRDIEGLSLRDAATIVGATLAATKSRLHRARLRLMGTLRAGEGGVVNSERVVGALSCRQVLELLGDYVDSDLDPDAKGRIDEHLRGCTVCERFGGRYANVVYAARERLGAQHDIDAATHERVLGRLRENR